MTGAGKGLGRACAIALAEAGATVIGISRTQSDLKKLEKEFIVEAESLSQKKLKELKTTKIGKEILASQTKVN